MRPEDSEGQPLMTPSWQANPGLAYGDKTLSINSQKLGAESQIACVQSTGESHAPLHVPQTSPLTAWTTMQHCNTSTSPVADMKCREVLSANDVLLTKIREIHELSNCEVVDWQLDQGWVHVILVKKKFSLSRLLFLIASARQLTLTTRQNDSMHAVLLVQELKRACTNGHWHPHDDALGYARHRVLSTGWDTKDDPRHRQTNLGAPHGCIKQMVGCLLKRGQHKDAFFHLGDTKASNTQHFALRPPQSAQAAMAQRLVSQGVP
jgi:hypothetical protein